MCASGDFYGKLAFTDKVTINLLCLTFHGRAGLLQHGVLLAVGLYEF